MLYSRQLKSAFLWSFLSLIRKKTDLVFITFHNIKPDQFEWFEKVVDFIYQEFGFASADDLSPNIKNHALEGKVILTFDDGYLSNRRLAEKVLDNYSVKALFFITEGFIGLDLEDSFQFCQKHFFPKTILNSEQKSQYMAMSWDDIKWLVEQGHTIGGHTQSHPVLSAIPDVMLSSEIIDSADRIEQRINQELQCFAFPFGNVQSVSNSVITLAKMRFKYIFSNVRGAVNNSPGNQFIYRQNIVPGDPLWLVKAIIEGKLDWKYRNQQLMVEKFFS